jgi:multicomponent Na+:H+ antiporter subunit F
MFIISAVAILLTMGMAIARGLRGPTVYDRALAVNMFGTATVLLIAVLGFLTGRPDFLDLALVYALLSFVGTIAILKYVSYGDLGSTREPEGAEEEWTW